MVVRTQATLDSMSIRDGDKAHIGVAEFVAALTKLLAHCSNEELDAAIVGLVEGRKVRRAAAPRLRAASASTLESPEGVGEGQRGEPRWCLLVSRAQLGAAVHPTNPLLEVEPARYRELLGQMELPEHVMQISTLDVIDAVDGTGHSQLLLIDVRGAEEVAVSTLPGALHVPVVEDEAAALGW